MSDTYLDKLQDPRWQKRRTEIWIRDGWKCRDCGRSDRTLTVHHCIYVKGLEPWEYDPSLLLTLCMEPCHMLRQTAELRARMSHATVLATLPVPEIEKYTWSEMARLYLKQSEMEAA
jgi:5-methylcytosine-specific restriction endonuclease McrA